MISVILHELQCKVMMSVILYELQCKVMRSLQKHDRTEQGCARTALDADFNESQQIDNRESLPCKSLCLMRLT